MKRQETLEDLGGRILSNCRNELYRYFPYLDGAFASLEIASDENSLTISVDGEKIIFASEFLIRKYSENPIVIKRGYLHILLHCLFLHVFAMNEKRDQRLWNVACDIAVEQMIDWEVEKKNLSALRLPSNDIRENCMEVLKNTVYSLDILPGNDTIIENASQEIFSDKINSAELIYQMLVQNEFVYSTQEMEAAFRFDDHSIWGNCNIGEKSGRLRKKWERVLSYTAQNRPDGQNHRGNQAGDGEEMLESLKKGRYDYRRFLKKFAFPREEVELDTESFDYIFYHYGLEHYGNLPLIEPLEYKEVNRLEELVIAIDTSGSCSREMIQQFLDETYRIFSEKENFFRKMKVHILQCDCYLQDVAIIHSEEEWKEYSRNIVIQGRSGTNFRPVFHYVEEQRKKKEIKNLKALIYFTDGDGVFPEKTDYETAFVFVKKCECMDLIPGWITKLLIYQE